MYEALRLCKRFSGQPIVPNRSTTRCIRCQPKEAELRRIGQIFSRLAKNVSRASAIAGVGKIIGKKGSRSIKTPAVVGQTENLLSI
jgi:hypothetical protein